MWLKEFSNFHLPADHIGIVHEELVYPSVEHFFVAMKSDDPDWRWRIAQSALAPGKIKQLGKELNPSMEWLGKTLELRRDWQKVRVNVLKYGVGKKFLFHDRLLSLLMETGEEEIVHRVHWHDNFWASCVCPNCANKQKHNVLGQMLMELRGQVREGNVSKLYSRVAPYVRMGNSYDRIVYFGTPCKEPVA